MRAGKPLKRLVQTKVDTLILSSILFFDDGNQTLVSYSRSIYVVSIKGKSLVILVSLRYVNLY